MNEPQGRAPRMTRNGVRRAAGNLGNAASLSPTPPLFSTWLIGCLCLFSLKTGFLSCSVQMVGGMAASHSYQVHKLSRQSQERLTFCLSLSGFHVTTDGALVRSAWVSGPGQISWSGSTWPRSGVTMYKQCCWVLTPANFGTKVTSEWKTLQREPRT